MSDEAVTARRLADLLTKNDEAITNEWVGLGVTEMQQRSSRAELHDDVRLLLESITAALSAGCLHTSDAPFEGTRRLLTELSRSRARQGFTPRETSAAVFALKDAVLTACAGEGEGLYRDFPALSRLVDDLGLITFESFAAAREQVITEQAEQLLELSTPVVKLWDGVLAVPLVGTLDSARTQVVMEKLLQMLVETGSEHAIIDITGVPTVDTQVAQHLLKTVVAARLMGADCIISGIRPQIAQTIVALGIEFGDIRTKASLADALMAALRSSGVTVSGRRRREP